MHLIAEDIVIHAFTPDDGSASAAIKVVHRTSRQESISSQTPSQIENLRRAMGKVVSLLNPNPDHLSPPDFMIFDRVRVNLPQSNHDGKIIQLSWDYKSSEWKYYVECSKEVVSAWYVGADLNLLDEYED